ncbi:YrzI family small protein [Anoxybacteroides amylolyticum]|uniref:Putative sporulation family protein n=1 Tax=Anoxybacteroides amylolyticum TaxID=294699 RepID=A0A167TPB8_9BACL|nr:YrzI family small protein [Anoxybacillus amylolyticus]ANB61724.1 putative sporulation family protein [Anoxybacillus amylolyticus]
MTIHLWFVTITIQRRQWTMEEIEHERLIRQIEEELTNRKCLLHQWF